MQKDSDQVNEKMKEKKNQLEDLNIEAKVTYERVQGSVHMLRYITLKHL